MDDVDWTVTAHGRDELTMLAPDALRRAEVANLRPQQRITPGSIQIAQNINNNLMASGKAFDEPQERRRDTFPSALVESSGRHKRDAHQGNLTVSGLKDEN